MNSLSFLSSSLLSTYSHKFPSKIPKPLKSSSFSSTPFPSFCSLSSSSSSSSAFDVSYAIPIEEIVEKDWSFIDTADQINPEEEHTRKATRIIKAGAISENSRILVSLCSEDFVDRLVDSSSSELLLVVHYSLFVLAGIKEKYDRVRCWQGDLVDVPEKWAPFDAVFLCYLPALPFSLDRIFRALAGHCSPGARLVIGYSQGREMVEQHLQQFPDMVTSELPDRITLENVAAENFFQITEFVDEPNFYLTVLKYFKNAEASTD
eukprot:TRINITY_DN20658_c0_g1_i1.p1 TRINITY_DN20658_c0_g1~~TRINITY_DN20658_c0_g1_i1.p1  ORF type:complete len:263 (+),score=37.38 TRINITY_DN20658_c0_g1_i1:324-1112(+)